MATKEEEKLLQNQQTAEQPAQQTAAVPAADTNAAVSAPMSYGGSYDNQIHDLYKQISDRPAFKYDVNSDALFQQYKDQYVNNAKRSMKDTLGQAAALTGGYGSSYGQAAGQQMYDKQMEGLTGIIPQLQQQAYGFYQDQGDALKNQYGMLTNLAATEQNTKGNNYNDLTKLIGSTGYEPTEEELAKAGMNAEQAKALRQAWIVANPVAAYNAGAIDPNGYYAITGAWPPGYTPPSSGGDYGYYGGGPSPGPSGKSLAEIADAAGYNNPMKAVYAAINAAPAGTYSQADLKAATAVVNRKYG